MTELIEVKLGDPLLSKYVEEMQQVASASLAKRNLCWKQEQFVTVRKIPNKEPEQQIQETGSKLYYKLCHDKQNSCFYTDNSTIDLAGEKVLSTGIYSYKLYRLFREIGTSAAQVTFR